MTAAVREWRRARWSLSLRRRACCTAPCSAGPLIPVSTACAHCRCGQPASGSSTDLREAHRHVEGVDRASCRVQATEHGRYPFGLQNHRGVLYRAGIQCPVFALGGSSRVFDTESGGHWRRIVGRTDASPAGCWNASSGGHTCTRFRNQTGCSRHRTLAPSRAPMAELAEPGHGSDDGRSHLGARGRSADGETRADRISQPNDSDSTRTEQSPANVTRFSPRDDTPRVTRTSSALASTSCLSVSARETITPSRTAPRLPRPDCEDVTGER